MIYVIIYSDRIDCEEVKSLEDKTCCFLGHRKVENADRLEQIIYEKSEQLITKENIYTFLFGSKSKFDDLCYKVISNLKEIYPHIKRVYVRAEYSEISEDYKNYLLEFYEDTYFPEKIVGAGKCSYVERNYIMIDKSNFCIVYYNPEYKPPMRKNSNRDLFEYQPKSGTHIAYEYAKKKGVNIINVFDL